MPEMNVEDFKFPDEKQESQEQEEQFEVEIEDDTPSEDVSASLCLNLW
jgi:hypothetical protein